MKTKSFTKILALIITLVMAMSVMCVPAMATGTAGVDFLTAGSSKGDLNSSYTRAQFVADFNAATNKAVLTFEEGTYETAAIARQNSGTGRYSKYGGSIAGFNVPISNCEEAELNVYWKNYYVNGDTDVSTKVSNTKGATSGNYSLDVTTVDQGPNLFVFGYQKPDGTSASVATTSLTRLRPTAVGFMYSMGGTTGNYINGLYAKYTDGTEENIDATDVSERIFNWPSYGTDTATTGYFVGVKAPEGKFIQHIQFKCTATTNNVDDICVILEDPNELDEEGKVETFEISGPTEVEQPAHNTVKEYNYSAVAKDIDENVLNPEISWKLDGNYGGNAEIDANGKLTVKSGIDVDTINVKAYVYSAALGAEKSSDAYAVTVDRKGAYLRQDRWISDFTSYTREQFVKDMDAAQYKAVFNFEDGNHEIANTAFHTNGTGRYNMYGGSINGYNTSISNCTDAELNLYWKGYQTTLSGGVAGAVKSTFGATSGDKSIAVWTNEGNVNRFVFGYQNLTATTQSTSRTSLTTLRPTAVGFMYSTGSSASGGINRVNVKYTDGSEANIDVENDAVSVLSWPTSTPSAGNSGHFIGIKAPAGKYIQHIDFYNDAGNSYIDDICVILEDPTLATYEFTKDANRYYEIENLSDIAASSDVYVTLPANGVAGSKLILAAYSATGLIDVNITDANPAGGVAQAKITVGTDPVKAVKAFVWDSITGLKPIGDYAIIK